MGFVALWFRFFKRQRKQSRTALALLRARSFGTMYSGIGILGIYGICVLLRVIPFLE